MGAFSGHDSHCNPGHRALAAGTGPGSHQSQTGEVLPAELLTADRLGPVTVFSCGLTEKPLGSNPKPWVPRRPWSQNKTESVSEGKGLEGLDGVEGR